METETRTIYSSHLQNCKFLKRPFTVLPNSTLNQKFNIYQDELPAVNEYPALQYIGIGNKGSSYELSTTGFALSTPIPHLPSHAALYNHIPFIIREEGNDLSSTDRMLYRMRVPMTIGGVNYIAYYLKVLPISTVTPGVELRSVNGNSVTATTFTPSASDLSPQPPVISSNNLNTANGDYLAATAKINFVLNESDIGEIINACNIIYNDARYAVINEICLVTGIDRILQGTFGTVTSNYTEVISAQVAAFISQNHTLTPNSESLSVLLDTGSVEPMLVNN